MNTTTTLFHFLVKNPVGDLTFHWIGGGLRPSEKPGYVWLTTPGGDPVLEVPKGNVTPLSRDQAERAIAESIKAQRDDTCQCDLCQERRLLSARRN